MSVPVTMFTATTTSDASTVKRIAASACALVTASQNADAPPVVDSATTAASGIRTTRLRYAVASAPPIAGPADAQRCAAPAAAAARRRQLVLTPRLSSIPCITESLGSKNFFMTAGQPPNFVMSNCFGGSG